MIPPCAVMLRPARLPDAQAMAEMSRQLIETGLAWRYTPPRITALIGDAATAAIVAHDEGERLHGFAVMQFGDEHAHLVLLCVHAAQQRQGIGRRMIEWLLASARVAGIATVQLELRADNDRALAFYRRLGFTPTQQVPGYYDGRVTAQRMALALRSATA